MGTSLSQEITESLRVLGLEPGASPADVRAAFRYLAHACHPDVVGQEGTRHFQEITGAYALLRRLSAKELEELVVPPAGGEGRGERKNLFDWYRGRAGRLDGTGLSRQESRRRSARVDLVLERYGQRLARHLEQLERSRYEEIPGGVLSRLKSSSPEVRRLALSRVGAFVNREPVCQAVAAVLNRWEVDEGTARLVSGFPMTGDTRRQLAEGVAAHAGTFPNSLLAFLLGLRQQDGKADLPLMERYLTSASPDGVALILRHWPAGHPPADATLRRLLASDDPRILVPALSAMKQRFPKAALRHKRRLEELQEHPSPAVRVWCRVLGEGASLALFSEGK